jgi:hypothetical protein
VTDLIQQLTDTLPAGTLIILVPGLSSRVSAAAPPSSDVAGSPDELAASKLKQASTGPLTLAEWGRALPHVSARELDRAHRAGALRTQVRTSGAGHGAIEASADAVIEYLQTCCAIQQAALPAPAWWDEVRRGSNGRIHG